MSYSLSEGAHQPQPLPHMTSLIQVDRSEGRLRIAPAYIHFGRVEKDHAQQVLWRVEGGLLPDELILLYSKPLEWTGPETRDHERDPLVCELFPETLMLSRQRPEIFSGAPKIDVIRRPRVACHYGAILLRGDDEPWSGSALIKVNLHS